MTTILNHGTERVLRLFYGAPEELHLREIARKTGLYGQSITRYLNQLEKDNILNSRKDANLRKYSLRKNKKVFSILAFFDVERFEKLPFARKNALKHYFSKLEQKPVFAILFGSTAKETFKDNSDIDLLLVTNRKLSTKEAEKEASALTAMKVSTFQITYAHFIQEIKLKSDPVVQSAIFSGYPIYNHIAYYEELNYERV